MSTEYIQVVDLGYGVKLLFGGKEVFLQGDDADLVRAEEEKVCAIWARRYGKGYRKAFGPFRSYEEHLTACLDCYF
jgi:hypothetical protein